MLNCLFFHRVFWQPPQQNNFNAQQSNNSPNQPSNQRFVRTAQVHISYLSKQLNLVVSEDFLRDIFSNFGEVLEVSLKKVAIDPVSFTTFAPCRIFSILSCS